MELTVINSTLVKFAQPMIMKQYLRGLPDTKKHQLPIAFIKKKPNVFCYGASTNNKNPYRLNLAYVGQLRGVKEAAQSASARWLHGLHRTARRLVTGANFCENLRFD